MLNSVTLTFPLKEIKQIFSRDVPMKARKIISGYVVSIYKNQWTRWNLRECWRPISWTRSMLYAAIREGCRCSLSLKQPLQYLFRVMQIPIKHANKMYTLLVFQNCVDEKIGLKWSALKYKQTLQLTTLLLNKFCLLILLTKTTINYFIKTQINDICSHKNTWRIKKNI